ncbi:hypothetical protein [Burkholderia sp. WAC0059]|uniref:hypothetical protein n=1 Tax=Burkholderia sp. WAC0059 TaxID=2066022 RepID=UPI0011AF7B1C|nr:hypothetical protein [Burkholderia sp. WAC0059]
MARFESRTYIGGKLFSTGTVTSASLTEPRMSVERALIAQSHRAGGEARRAEAQELRSAVQLLPGKFKTSAELAVLMGGDGESDESDI